MGATPPSGRVVTLKDGRTRTFRSKQEQWQIVEETLKASASVVARAHGVNANQVFKWRKRYREGRLDITPPSGAASTLLPVKISDSAPTVRPTPARQRSKSRRAGGIIDIDLGHARVRIEGEADPECVRAALEGLRR